MKLVVSSAHLRKQLSALSGVIMNNPLVPILENFLFQIKDGKLIASASDLQISITVEVEVETDEEGAIAVPARELMDTLKELPDQPIHIEIEEENSRFEIKSHNGFYKLIGEKAEDFPKIPQPDGDVKLIMTSDILSTAISSTIFAISNDELRPAMTGLFLKLGSEQSTFVSTDGNRLVKYERKDLKAGSDLNMIIPKKALSLLKSSLATDDTEVITQFSSTHAFFQFQSFQLSCRLIDESFPDYENAIPTDNPNQLHINRGEMLNSLKRLSIYANKATNQVRFKLSENNLEIFAEDLDFNNEAQETLQADYSGDAMEIGFNAKYLIEMLTNLDSDDINFSFSTPNRAGILTPQEKADDEDILMLIMPVMLTTYA